MPYKPVDTAIKVVVGPLIDDTDFKTREEAVAHNAPGMEIDVILEKHDGTVVITPVVPTSGGDYDWAHLDQGWYELELPASGGSSFNNTEAGILTVVGYATGALPFSSVAYDIVPVQVYDSIVRGTDRLHVDIREKGDSLLGLTTQEISDVNAEVNSVLNTAVPASPTPDSINERIKTLDDNYGRK